MTEHQQLKSHDHQPGDKVLVRAGPHKGTRGVITADNDELLAVQIAPDAIAQLAYDDVTNFSRAARRAWQNMPKRAGRPKSPTPPKKMVSLRIDQDLWGRLGQAVEAGLIPSREHAINTWIRNHLDDLLEEHHVTDNQNTSSQD